MNLKRIRKILSSAEKFLSSRQIDSLAENFFRLRYAIGAAFLLLCVLLEVHGSSIGMYGKFLDHPELQSIIFGVPRQIRSDEYIVFTPFAFAQYFTGFSMISDIVRGAATNMFMTYGQAVWHPAIIFRPAQIGYLFLDQGSGLAFFWVSRLVVLMLVSIEFARKILQVNRPLAVLYALMVTFSPLAQWWWSVNSIAEILAAGQGVVLCWKFYLATESKRRFLYAAAGLWCAGVYIFGIYPAWQVPFGWTFLLCLIAVTSKGALKILRRDKIFWLVGLTVMLAPIAHALYVSRDMIAIQMATDYPGQRFETGGHWSPIIMLYYGMDCLIPFLDTWHSGGLNNLEFATFFSMAPLGWLMFFWLTFELKQRDFLMTALFGLSVFLLIWETVDFPPLVAKVTLMSNVIANRARTVIDFAQMLMVFRGLSLMKNSQPTFIARLVLAAIIALMSAAALKMMMPAWFGVKKFIAVTGFVSLSTFLIISPMSRLRAIALALMMLFMGATVNPINLGVDVVFKMPVGQKIAAIARDDKGLWMVENDGVWINDFPIMFGAPTINSVNVYPVLDRWKKIDPDGKNFTRYNRYANIIMTLTAAPTEFIDMGLLDHCKINLNVNDLPKLDVRYILSRNGDLEKFSTGAIKIRKLFDDAGSFIYSVDYAS